MSNYKFETLQLHVGQEQADPATDARAVPIYQTTSYVFHNSQHAADRFGLADPGNIYGRLTNSTQGVFEERVAALEGGSAALAVASGAAAITYAIEALAANGGHIVAQKTIYGGSFNLLAHTLPQYGVTTTFVDIHDLDEVKAAIKDNTKAIFIETLGNPNSDIPDIEALAELAHSHSIPRCRHRRPLRHQVPRRPRHDPRRCHRRVRQVRLESRGQISADCRREPELSRHLLCRRSRTRSLCHVYPCHPPAGHRRRHLSV